LAVPNRVTALGGSRIVCGRALCRQSPNRRHSALELPVPRREPGGPRHFTSRPRAASGGYGPKIFLLCDAASPRAQVPDSASLFVCLTPYNSFIRLRFSVISRRRHQPVVQRPDARSRTRIHAGAAEGDRGRAEAVRTDEQSWPPDRVSGG
jgi:hypothetical protein